MTAQRTATGGQTLLISTFRIGNTLCGIDAMRVQEVVRVGEVTRVHRAPENLIGIINLRGKIVTVLDLGVTLELGRLTVTPASRIFILEWQGEYVGLLADAAGDVVSLQPETVGPPPANFHGVQGRFFTGVCQHQDTLIAILNADAVLSEEARAR